MLLGSTESKPRAFSSKFSSSNYKKNEKMKKLILLLILIPIASFAKFYPGNLTLKDGTTINGFIELPEYPDDAKLKFRREEKGSNEKYTSDEVNSFEIVNSKNEKVRYITIQLAKPKLFNLKEIKIETKKSWVKIIKEGKISLYSAYYSYSSGSGTGGGAIYYIKREKDDYALYLQEYGGGGITFNMNGFQNLKKFIKLYFDESCPKLVNFLDKEDINKNGLVRIIDLYETNCGK